MRKMCDWDSWTWLGNMKWDMRQKERIRKLNERLGYFYNIIDIIAAGRDQDDDVECFGDYYNTVLRMKIFLDSKGCKGPYRIVSQKEVFWEAGAGNNLAFIATRFEKESDAHDLIELGIIKGYIKEIVVDERAYILSRSWIQEWILDDDLGEYEGDYRLLLTDGKKAVITGPLTLLGILC